MSAADRPGLRVSQYYGRSHPSDVWSVYRQRAACAASTTTAAVTRIWTPSTLARRWGSRCTVGPSPAAESAKPACWWTPAHVRGRINVAHSHRPSSDAATSSLPWFAGSPGQRAAAYPLVPHPRARCTPAWRASATRPIVLWTHSTGCPATSAELSAAVTRADAASSPELGSAQQSPTPAAAATLSNADFVLWWTGSGSL